MSADKRAAETAIRALKDGVAYDGRVALRNRVAEIADDILGLQPADSDCIALLDAIEKEYHRERIECSAARVALSHISGALCDSGVVVPADELRYGEAVREIVRQRDELKARLDEVVYADGSLTVAAEAERNDLSERMADATQHIIGLDDHIADLESKLAAAEKLAEDRRLLAIEESEARMVAEKRLAELARNASALAKVADAHVGAFGEWANCMDGLLKDPNRKASTQEEGEAAKLSNRMAETISALVDKLAEIEKARTA